MEHVALVVSLTWIMATQDNSLNLLDNPATKELSAKAKMGCLLIILSSYVGSRFLRRHQY